MSDIVASTLQNHVLLLFVSSLVAYVCSVLGIRLFVHVNNNVLDYFVYHVCCCTTSIIDCW